MENMKSDSRRCCLLLNDQVPGCDLALLWLFTRKLGFYSKIVLISTSEELKIKKKQKISWSASVFYDFTLASILLKQEKRKAASKNDEIFHSNNIFLVIFVNEL